MMGWLIALIILVLLAILPLGVIIRYDSDGLSIPVIVGPVRFTVYPGKKKKKKKSKDEKKKNKQASKEVNTASKGGEKKKSGSITDFLPLVPVVLELLDDLRWKLRMNRLELKLIMAGDDPADLGMNYGKAWAAVGNLVPMLERSFVIKKKDIEVECDFTASETLVTARLDITITFGRLIALVVVYGIRGLREYMKIVNKRKGGAVK